MRVWAQCLLFLLTAAAIVARRPDALFHPQFYAEDGAVWYAQAYNLGWLHSLTIPEGGYLNTLPRLVCGLALFAPLRDAPAILNLFGIAIQALPVTILLSSRCAAWGSLPFRALHALIYLVLPNSNELDVTITNAHWHLVLVLCLIAFGTQPLTRAWMAFDVAVVLICGLTGPWALVLTPLTLIFWWIRRQRWSVVVAALLGACALIQAAELATAFNRPMTPLGATPELLLRLIAGQIYFAAIWGENAFVTRAHIATTVLVFFLGTAVLIYALVKCGLERRLFIAFSLLILMASLRSPLIEGALPRWQLLTIVRGGRYCFFPMLALLWSLLWCAAQTKPMTIRWVSIAALVVFLRGVRHDWRYRPYKDENFSFYVNAFERAAPGTKITIPIYPDGHQMELIKK